MRKVSFDEVAAMFPKGIPMEAIDLCLAEHDDANDLRAKLKALAMTTTEHDAAVEVWRFHREPVQDADDALRMLDDVESLVRFCAVNMPDVERYQRGGEAMWRVAHWIAESRAISALATTPPREEHIRDVPKMVGNPDHLMVPRNSEEPQQVMQPCDTCGKAVAVHAISPSECFCSAECADPMRDDSAEVARLIETADYYIQQLEAVQRRVRVVDLAEAQGAYLAARAALEPQAGGA